MSGEIEMLAYYHGAIIPGGTSLLDSHRGVILDTRWPRFEGNAPQVQREHYDGFPAEGGPNFVAFRTATCRPAAESGQQNAMLWALCLQRSAVHCRYW